MIEEPKVKPLTKGQNEVLEFLIEFHRLFGYMPTTRDIQQKFGFKSQTGAVTYLKALTAKGYIERKRKARSITILKTPDDARN